MRVDVSAADPSACASPVCVCVCVRRRVYHPLLEGKSSHDRSGYVNESRSCVRVGVAATLHSTRIGATRG